MSWQTTTTKLCILLVWMGLGMDEIISQSHMVWNQSGLGLLGTKGG